jgi:hypothetical protein
MCVVCLAACGGGGGGGGGGDGGNAGGGVAGGGGGGGTVVTTGFVPAAPAVGDTLYARASVLRPLREGSRYVYRRREANSSTADEVVLSQSAGAGGTVVETYSSDPTDPTTVSVDASTGAVNFSGVFRLAPNAAPIAIAGAELPSPLRQNAQITVFDQRVTSTGIDADGDGRSDSVDLAIWRLVVGNEPVSLPNVSTPVTCLRVDTFLKARILPSGGSAAVTVESRVSTWYLQGVGMVREITAGTEGRAFDDEDVLLGYDGVSQGFGYVLQSAISPTPGAGGAGVVSVVASGDIVLATNGRSSLLRLDRSGRLLSREALAVDGRLVALTSGVRLLSGRFPRYSLQTLSAAGALATTPPVSFDFSGGRDGTAVEYDPVISVVPGASRIWFAWLRSFFVAPSQPLGYEIVVRGVDGQGLPGAAETRIPVAFPNESGSVRLAAHPGGGVVVTWQEYETSNYRINHWVRIDDHCVVVDQFAVGPLAAVTQSLSPTWEPVLSSGRQWATWVGPDVTGAPLVRHAVEVGTGGLLATGADIASLQAAVLGAIGVDDANAGPRLWAPSGTRIFTLGGGAGPIAPAVPFGAPWTRVTEFDLSGGAQAASSASVADYRIPLAASGFAPAAVVMEDRVLFITENAGALQPVLVWRR